MDHLELWRLSKLARLQRPRIVTRRQAKAAGKGLRREKQPNSMLNMERPFGHRPVAGGLDRKTGKLWLAHKRRLEAGWIRG